MPSDFKIRLKARGWTIRRFSEETGTPLRTVEEWSRGSRRAPCLSLAYMDLLDRIDALNDQGEVIARLRARLRSLGGL